MKYAVEYEIRDNNVTMMKYIKEKQVMRLYYRLEQFVRDPEHFNYFDQEMLEWKESYSKVMEILKMDNEDQAIDKLLQIILATDEWDDDILDGQDEQDLFFDYATLDEKYNLLKRYFLVFKYALSYIGPAPSLTEEGDPNVLDSYLTWLEDLYNEINPKSKPPELSEEEMKDINSYSNSGYMGEAELAFGTFEIDYSVNGDVFDAEAHPSTRFDFQPNNEVSFKSRVKDILENKTIFYHYQWGLS